LQELQANIIMYYLNDDWYSLFVEENHH